MYSSTMRRAITIDPTPGRTAAHCQECGARHIGICDALSDEDLGFLSRAAQRVTVAAGRTFVEEAEPAGYFYNINAGTVRVFKTLPDGRRHITGFLGVGQFLGLDFGGNYAFSAAAMGDVALCRFHRPRLLEVFAEFPALERRLLNIASHELTAAHEQMLLLGRKTARERLASFIIGWAARAQSCQSATMLVPNARLTLPMSRVDLADYLGLTIETVSRSLNLFKKQGLLRLASVSELVLLQPQLLAEIAAGIA